ncbi:MerR family transcriptional regulator [Lactobacillus sp. HMSC077C11]|nr:MerR family transcriptional regulator [Lactobacillus sp. HMSC077C11]
MNIQEFAEETGLSKDTLRLYEKKQLLIPARTPCNYRCYNHTDAATAKVIINLKRAGLSLVECQKVLALQQRPITAECRGEALAFIQTKRRDAAAQARFYQGLLTVLACISQEIEKPTNNPQQVNDLINQVGELDD